jgi:hypothetical protein
VLEYSDWLNILYWNIHLLTEYFVLEYFCWLNIFLLEHFCWLNILCWNIPTDWIFCTGIYICWLNFLCWNISADWIFFYWNIFADWIFCAGISLLTEYFVRKVQSVRKV